MTVLHLLAQAKAYFASQLEAQMLLAFVLHKGREEIIAHPELELNEKGAQDFLELCKRRGGGVPIAYLTGHKEFYGLDFFVDERVLIPRPETELLVELVRESTAQFKAPRIVDVGTGSGCIAVSLAVNIDDATITAVDISADALIVAQKNAELNNVSDKISFFKSDLLSEVADTQFDIVVANLPYIGTSENKLIEKDVYNHEPHTALFGGETGLELFEKLFKQISSLKQKPAYVVGEIGFTQRQAITNLVQKYCSTSKLEFKKDLAGLDRAFIIKMVQKL